MLKDTAVYCLVLMDLPISLTVGIADALGPGGCRAQSGMSVHPLVEAQSLSCDGDLRILVTTRVQSICNNKSIILTHLY